MGGEDEQGAIGLVAIRIAVIMYLNFGVIYDKYKS